LLGETVRTFSQPGSPDVWFAALAVESDGEWVTVGR